MTSTSGYQKSIDAGLFFALIGRVLVWLSITLSSIVLFEPAPYEVFCLVALIGFFMAGLPVPRSVLPLIFLIVLFIIGGIGGLTYSLNFSKSAIYIAVTGFLGLTSIFFACYVAQSPYKRIVMIERAAYLAAIIACSAAFIGYMNIDGLSENFLLYDRARGTFKDPNVFGAFLILPAMWALYALLNTTSYRSIIISSSIVFITSLGIFLSFSRAAWGQLIFGALLLILISFILAPSNRIRIRISVLTISGIFLLFSLLTVIIALPQFSSLFAERFSLSQSYDIGHLGRFGRFIPGLLLAFENPLGIGPYVFRVIYLEEPHNVYLNSILIYGWLGGIAYFLLVIITLLRGARFILYSHPLRSAIIPIYVTFLVTALEGLIIDSDHWRHFFLMLGLLWGIMAVQDKKSFNQPYSLQNSQC